MNDQMMLRAIIGMGEGCMDSELINNMSRCRMDGCCVRKGGASGHGVNRGQTF